MNISSEEMFRWQSYPHCNSLYSAASVVKWKVHNVTKELMEHNPSLPISTSSALAELERSVETSLSSALKSQYQSDYDQRWLYKKLIEAGECP
jgi:hypothetical protein